MLSFYSIFFETTSFSILTEVIQMNDRVIQNSTQGERVLAALSYFSIFFAPIILPIFIWIFADRPTSNHAAKSLAYHIITYIGPILLILSIGFGGVLINNSSTITSVIMITVAIILFVITVWYTIKNIYRGVRVLISEHAYFHP